MIKHLQQVLQRRGLTRGAQVWPSTEWGKYLPTARPLDVCDAGGNLTSIHKDMEILMADIGGTSQTF